MGILDYFSKKEKVVKKSDVIETPEVAEKQIVVEKPKKVKATKTIKNTNPLVDECYKAIHKEIAKDFHKEAEEIIELTTEKHRQEFLDYHKKDQGNICCLVLDTAKRELVAEGKLQHHDDDAFGKEFML